MNDPLNVVIMCGGNGKRIPQLTLIHSCKSLIPIAGIPSIHYVLSAIKSITVNKTILCVDNDKLIPRIKKILVSLEMNNFHFFLDKGKGTIHALHEIKHKIDTNRILILFGHHLITTSHLQSLIRLNVDGIILSLYPTSSDNLRKIVRIDHKNNCIGLRRGNEHSTLEANERYSDVPFLVNKNFINCKTDNVIRSYDAIKNWFENENNIYGIEANSPHEFHTIKDIPIVEGFAKKLRDKLFDNNSL